jgi:hypothetical protein
MEFMLSGRRGSNPRPQPWQGCALPTELLPHIYRRAFIRQFPIHPNGVKNFLNWECKYRVRSTPEKIFYLLLILGSIQSIAGYIYLRLTLVTMRIQTIASAYH